MHPRLRPVEPHLVNHEGQPLVVLRDPLRLSDRTVCLPPPLALLLELCDGTRNEAGLRAALEIRAGIRLSAANMEQILSQFDEALLLENDRSAEAYAAAVREFRTAACRSPVLAGNSYPESVEALEGMLQKYSEAARGVAQQTDAGDTGDIRGLVCPHIDYQRGGPVYALVWQRAAQVIREAQIVIIFGTDHNGGPGSLTLTHQNYATPWGTLPTARHVVEAVSQAIGPAAAFQEELHHRSEHSIELAAVWLHYLLGEQSCELVPILCGSFHEFVLGNGQPGEEARLSLALEALREATAPYRTVVIAAADLAHLGPAFGDQYPIDFIQRAKLKAEDKHLMDTICAGDAEVLFQEIKQEGDRRRICGLPPIYLTLRFLGETRGETVGYDQCPADRQNTSFVSICGLVLR